MQLDRDEIIWISIALAARAKFYEDQGREEYGARYAGLKARWDWEMLYREDADYGRDPAKLTEADAWDDPLYDFKYAEDDSLYGKDA